MTGTGKRNAGSAYLLPYAKRYAGAFLLAFLFIAIEAACDLSLPRMMRSLIDEGVGSRDLSVVLSLGLAMLAATGIGAIAAMGRNIVSSVASQRFGAELRAAVYKRILALGAEDAERFEPSALVTRLTSDVTQVQLFANGAMRIFAKAPLQAAGGIVMAALLDPGLALVLLAVVPLVVVLVLANMKRSYPAFLRVQAALDRSNAVVRDYLEGIRTVKAFERQEEEERRFSAAAGELATASASAYKGLASFSPLVSLAANAGIAAALWIGGYRFREGTMGLGTLAAFVNYMIQILHSLTLVSWILNVLGRLRASVSRVGEVMAAPAVEAALLVLTAPVPSEGGPEPALSLRFDGVSFTYRDSRGGPALSGIGFALPAGSFLGIIGSTGSGKSTLAALPPRFYEAGSGAVIVGERDVRDWDERALRAAIGFVPQRASLFSGTIADNLRWGRPEASDAELERAAAIAQAAGFIESFPEGYGTVLGRGGVNLSGGQRQRLAIARALVRRPSLIIIDDGASALDALTEAALREAVLGMEPRPTLVWISQRVETIRSADSILALEEGMMAGLGSHRDLASSCEVYRDILASQGLAGAAGALHV